MNDKLEMYGEGKVYRCFYHQRTKHRRRCPQCGKLICEGARAVGWQHVSNGRPKTKFFHEDCFMQINEVWRKGFEPCQS